MEDGLASDAIVVFGVTGDLVHKEIFPALQGLMTNDGVDLPVIGVARSDWTDEDLHARAKDSLKAERGLRLGGVREARGATSIRTGRLRRGRHILIHA